MQPSLEDLLSVRDGEPVDPHAYERVAADARYGAEVERLRATQTALRGLAELEPPPGAWQRIEAAERETRYRSARWLRRAAGAGVAACVAASAIFYLGMPLAPALQAPVAARATPAAAREEVRPLEIGGRVVPASYTALVAESARLDRILGAISYQRPLMTGATASTIVGLEDRIGVIDEQLTYSTARRAPEPQREALWSERVELMNALVHLRYAQAQPAGF